MRNSNEYAILGLLSIQPMTGYDMKKWVENALSHFWKTSYGQIYPTLNRFVQEGLVTVAVIEAEKKGISKQYTITKLGMDVLKSWLLVDIHDFNSRDESQLQYYFSSNLSIEEVIEKAKRSLVFNQSIRDGYSVTKEKMEETKKPTRQQLNEYLAVRKGILLNEARIKWAEECIGVLEWYRTITEN